MALITWMVLGLIVGFSASKLINKTGESLPMILILGVAGAVTGGEFFNKFWLVGVKGVSFGGILMSAAAAVLFLAIYNALRDKPSKQTV